MFVMTAKVNKKKIAMILGAVAALIVIIAIALGSGKSEPTGSDISVNSNDDRVQFPEAVRHNPR